MVKENSILNHFFILKKIVPYKFVTFNKPNFNMQMLKKSIFIIVTLLLPIICLSQTITVDDSYTSGQLVNLLLNNSCIEITSTNMSTGQSVGYFNQNGSSFPLTEGIIIRNGNVNFTAGPYTNSNLSSSINLDSDPYLQNLSNQSSGQTTSIVDIGFLEFDFIPTSNSFSFNFLFASNEYGEFQCSSNDIFAFALTDLTTNITTNLAVIPGTSNPVSVLTIRNSAFNEGNSCSSSNPGLFSTYNVSNPPASSLNMRGHTVVMSASSGVIPNNPYRIRMSIADFGDADYDSAVFIGAGSFTTNFDLGPDQIICAGDEYILDTGLDNTYTFQWLLNGMIIAGETNPTYTVSQPGVYEVIIDKGSCHIEESITFNDLLVNNPQDLYACDTGAGIYPYNLTINNEIFLGIDDAIYDVHYFDSQADILANNPIPSADLGNFMSPGQTIYIKIFNTVTGLYCDAEYQFDLIVNPSITAGSIPLQNVCDNSSGVPYDLSIHDIDVINGQSGTYTITYYTNQSDATNGVNAIGNNINITNGTGITTFWIRIEDSNNSSCFDITSVDINVRPLPLVDAITNITECSNTTLPNITNGNYFTGPDGTGTNLGQGGAFIEDGGTYYIFAGPDAFGCTNQTSFLITFIDEFTPILDNCGVFSVPSPPEGIGAFYTDFGGPNGTGTLIPTGTQFENTGTTSIVQPIYYYAEVNGIPCRDERFDIYIHPLAPVDTLTDVTYCNSFTLEPLTNGNYFTGPNGTGTPLFAGTPITSSQTIYIYNTLNHISSDGVTVGFCPSPPSSFQVNIVNTSIFTPITECGSFTLPTITFGNYYDQPNGMGNIIDPSIPITSSQIVYYYANTTTLPNCTDNLNFNITINPRPLVDTIPSESHCGEFVLPPLTNGNYYMLSGGPTVPGQVELFPNQVIDLSGTSLNPGTYYIYNGPDANNCDNESSFTINILPSPLVDAVSDYAVCGPFYTISPATNGTIYTAPGGPNGTGTVVDSTTQYTENETFYLYSFDSNTTCEVDIPFTVFYNGIDLPDYPDEDVCEFDNYALPILTHVPPETTNNYSINYYLDSNGNGIPGDAGDTLVPAGTVFNTPNTVTTVYVVANNTGRFGLSCQEIDTITITVSETPNLNNHPANFNSLNNTTHCGEFILPDLNGPTINYTVNYYTQPGGNPNDLINPNDYTFSVAPDENPQTFDVWVYAHATNNSNCSDETHFQFTVYPRPTFEVDGGIICVDPLTNATLEPIILDSGLNPALFDVEWSLNGVVLGNGITFEAIQAGTYTITPIKLSPENAPDCNYLPTTAVVTISSRAVASVSVTQPFEDIANTTVTIENGFGNYIFQLDDGQFQTSNNFYNISSGSHTVTVRDTLGNCGDFVLVFNVIKYPKFFTPNADGYNDTWNIWDLRNEHPDAVIYIFDRYGKFLKELSPMDNGWDGKYNGHDLPSTDYWFTVDYLYNGEPAQFKAHFAMKR